MKDYKKIIIGLVTIMMVMASACGDKSDEPVEEYKYYILIQSQVPLELKDQTDEQGTQVHVHGPYDMMSRTIKRMKEVVAEYESQLQTTEIEATLFTTCDSIYNSYEEAYPQYQGEIVCYVQIVRSRTVNGASREGTTLKTYYFRAYNYENQNEQETPPSYSKIEKPEVLKAVDLGLSVMWANCNLGSKYIDGYGGLYAWGDTTGVLFSGAGITVDNNTNTYTSWNTENYGGMNPPADISGTELDIVAMNWGDGWRMPTYEEAQELCEKCEWKLCSNRDIKWYEVIGPNGNSIIMPLAGVYGDNPYTRERFHVGPYSVNVAGYYWTSTICSTPGTAEQRGYGVNSDIPTAWMFNFRPTQSNQDISIMFGDQLRAMHLSIRPVHD